MADSEHIQEIKSLLDDHRERIDLKLATHSAEIKGHVSGMGDAIIKGFEKVGDALGSEIRDFRLALLPAATSETKVSIKVVMVIIYTLCGVITALTVWFTGIEPNLPKHFTGVGQYDSSSHNSENSHSR